MPVIYVNSDGCSGTQLNVSVLSKQERILSPAEIQNTLFQAVINYNHGTETRWMAEPFGQKPQSLVIGGLEIVILNSTILFDGIFQSASEDSDAFRIGCDARNGLILEYLDPNHRKTKGVIYGQDGSVISAAHTSVHGHEHVERYIPLFGEAERWQRFGDHGFTDVIPMEIGKVMEIPAGSYHPIVARTPFLGLIITLPRIVSDQLRGVSDYSIKGPSFEKFVRTASFYYCPT